MLSSHNNLPERVPVEHGTNSSYCNRQCRCPECKAAHAAYVKDYRASQRKLREAEELLQSSDSE